MKYCANCQKVYDDNITNCPKCGMSLFQKKSDEEISLSNEKRAYQIAFLLTISYFIIFVILFIIMIFIRYIGSGLNGHSYILNFNEVIGTLAPSTFLVLVLAVPALLFSFKSKNIVLITINLVFLLLTIVSFFLG